MSEYQFVPGGADCVGARRVLRARPRGANFGPVLLIGGLATRAIRNTGGQDAPTAIGLVLSR